MGLFFGRDSTMPYALRGTLQGHNGAITSIATNRDTPDVLISASRDKTIISWTLNDTSSADDAAGVPKRSLQGHSHFIEDVVLSSDGAFALSCSWDRTLRLWDLKNGVTTKTFVGHDKDVLSVAFSADNRQIVSASRDRTIKLWNTLGECKVTIAENNHSEWISCVRFSPDVSNPIIVSCGWDRVVKVWDLQDFKLKYNLYGHTGYINTLAISPNGVMCASGGKDGNVMMWNLNERSHMFSLNAVSTINALEFSPHKYWLAVGTDDRIRIFDLDTQSVIYDLTDFTAAKSYGKRKPPCTSLAWSADGRFLYAGYADSIIRVWEMSE